MLINPSRIRLSEEEYCFFQEYVPQILPHTACIVQKDPDSEGASYGGDSRFWNAKYSGTMILLRTEESCFGVTCSHVIQDYRRCVEKDPSIELIKEPPRLEFSKMGIPIISKDQNVDDDYKINESVEDEVDLITLQFSEDEIRAMGLTPFSYEPSVSGELSCGEDVLIVGYPTPWTAVTFREDQSCEFTRNSCLALKMSVFEVTEHQFRLVSYEPPCYWVYPEPSELQIPPLPRLGFLGGISGAGVYMIRDDRPILCGIVTRGWGIGVKKIYCTRIRCVQKDGTITITPSFEQLMPTTLLEKINDCTKTAKVKEIKLGLIIRDEMISFEAEEEVGFQKLIKDGILYRPDETKNPNLYQLTE